MTMRGLFIIAFLLPLSCGASNKEKPSFSFFSKISPTHEIIIDHVFPNSPAKHGGFKSGDQVLEINGEPIFSYKGFRKDIDNLPYGIRSIFTVLRDNRKIKIDIVPRKGRYSFGFSYKVRDPEIARQLKFKIWPDDVDTTLRKFTVPFHLASLENRSSRSPKQKVLHRIREILTNKGYVFTENYESANFIVETEYKTTKTVSSPGTGKKRKLPFEAFRVLFIDRRNNKPFFKVSGSLDLEKSKIYGVKGYVYAMLDAMIEKFPPYRNQEESAITFAASDYSD